MIEKIRNIAVIGTGFAGLSLAWQLAKFGYNIDLFEDPERPAASLKASGLLHLFHGTQARLPPQAQEAMNVALEQLYEFDHSEYLEPITLLRPASNQMQASIFAKRARQHPLITEYKPLPWDESLSALWIYQAYWIDSLLYLQALRSTLKQKGARFFQKNIGQDELEHLYDQVVFACGYASAKMTGLGINEDWTLTRGQLKHFVLEKEPPYPLNGKTYLIPQKHSKTNSDQKIENRKWIMGSTFERIPFDTEFDHQSFEIEARTKLCEQTQRLWPAISIPSATQETNDPSQDSWHIGYRLAGPGHLPLIAQLTSKSYLFTGLGSKGLLYAAFLGKKLAAYMQTNESFLPYQPHG